MTMINTSGRLPLLPMKTRHATSQTMVKQQPLTILAFPTRSQPTPTKMAARQRFIGCLCSGKARQRFPSFRLLDSCHRNVSPMSPPRNGRAPIQSSAATIKPLPMSNNEALVSQHRTFSTLQNNRPLPKRRHRRVCDLATTMPLSNSQVALLLRPNLRQSQQAQHARHLLPPTTGSPRRIKSPISRLIPTTAQLRITNDRKRDRGTDLRPP